MRSETEPKVESCARCKYSIVGEANAQLQRPMLCRRFPPQTNAVAVPQQGGVGLAQASNFPAVAEDQWCGEFVPAIADA